MGILSKKNNNQEKIIMDLGDFQSQNYELIFTINGHKYEFKYGEVNVDEMLGMMHSNQEEMTDKTDYRDIARKRASSFLQKYCTEGDKKQLEEDINLVPYSSRRGKLSIKQIFDNILNRSKKKHTNGETV